MEINIVRKDRLQQFPEVSRLHFPVTLIRMQKAWGKVSEQARGCK
jgi:hypothetical protein